MKKQITFIFLFFILSISIITATSSIQDVEDLCIQPAYQYYDINLTEYINFHVDDECYLWAKDPLYNGTSGHYHTLPAGYSTLNTYYYEVSYYFNSGHDWLRFETLPENETVGTHEIFLDGAPLAGDGFQFYCCQEGNCGDKYFHNVFSLNISDSCELGPEQGGGGGGGGSGVWENITSYWKLDNNDLTDELGVNNATNTGSINASGALISARDFDGTNDRMDMGVINDISSLSFWFKVGDTSGGEEDIIGQAWQNTEVNGDWLMLVHTDGKLDFGLYEPTLNYLGGSTVVDDNSWHHVVITTGSNGIKVYLDGLSEINDSSTKVLGDTSTANFTIGARGANSAWLYGNVVIDEVGVWQNHQLNISSVQEIYNSGTPLEFNNTGGGGGGDSGNPPVLNSSIPDINQSQSTIHHIDMNNYFWNWSEMYVKVDDPLSDFEYQIWTGYCTLNADYYDLCLFANGSLFLESYSRPYNYDVDAFACNNVSAYNECVNDTFNVNVNGSLSGVLKINPFLSPINLGYDSTDYDLFAGNYYFQYYENITFSFPDTNSTGVLDANFTQNWTTRTDNRERGTNYTINLFCNYDTYTYYNVLADLNITVQCGSKQAYFYIAPYQNYNETVYFNATNSVNTTSGSFLLYGGNPALVANEVVPLFNQNITITNNNVTVPDNFFGALTDKFAVFYTAESDEAKNWTVWVSVLMIAVGIFFILFGFLPFSVIFNIILVFVILVLFFFVNVSYIEPSTAMKIGTSILGFWMIKYLLGRPK